MLHIDFILEWNQILWKQLAITYRKCYGVLTQKSTKYLPRLGKFMDALISHDMIENDKTCFLIM